jgi:hypothetical protein
MKINTNTKYLTRKRKADLEWLLKSIIKAIKGTEGQI